MVESRADLEEMATVWSAYITVLGALTVMLAERKKWIPFPPSTSRPSLHPCFLTLPSPSRPSICPPSPFLLRHDLPSLLPHYPQHTRSLILSQGFFCLQSSHNNLFLILHTATSHNLTQSSLSPPQMIFFLIYLNYSFSHLLALSATELSVILFSDPLSDVLTQFYLKFFHIYNWKKERSDRNIRDKKKGIRRNEQTKEERWPTKGKSGMLSVFH